MTAILTGPDATVGAMFREFGGAFLQLEGEQLFPQQQRALQELALCRTPQLGYVQWVCERCGSMREICNPCRSRHCPGCQGHLLRSWSAGKQGELLDLSYDHAVLTIPHELNVLLTVERNQKPVYDRLFQATSQAIQQVAQHESPLQATVGMQVVLHTWNQLLKPHIHFHVAVPCGGWSIEDPDRFVTTDDPQWLDEAALMRAFRTAALAGLERARAGGELKFWGEAAALADAETFTGELEKLRQREWIVYAKPSQLSPAETLDYLARYLNRSGISNRRIKQIDLAQREVTFTYRNNHNDAHEWGGIETKTICVFEFIRRFLFHILPHQMARCRGYGFWSPPRKGKDLPRIRQQLGQAGPPSGEEDNDGDGDGQPDPLAEDEEPGHVDEDLQRRMCKVCEQRSMVVLDQVRKPTVYQMMQLKIWPEQYGYGKNDAASEDRQLELPGVRPYLPGGTVFLEGMTAQPDQLNALEYL